MEEDEEDWGERLDLAAKGESGSIEEARVEARVLTILVGFVFAERSMKVLVWTRC